MKEIKPAVLLIGALAIVSVGGCAKSPPADSSSQANMNAANANVPDLSSTPLYAKTIRGDVERAGLAIMMAHDLVKQEQWGDAVVQLRAAQTQIDDILGQKPRLREQYEELRSALGRTIQSADNRSKDIEAQFTELQTRIGALKVYIDQ
jgi:hypothetical protein